MINKVEIGLNSSDINYSEETLNASALKQKKDKAEAAIARNILKKIQRNESVKSEAIKSLDYSYISNEEYREDFKQLCQDWEERVLLRYNIKHCETISDKHVEAKCWGRFILNSAYKYNYKVIDHKITYNKDHYAIWGEDPIYIISDFQIWMGNGKLMKFSRDHYYALDGKNNKYAKRSSKLSGMNADQILDYYCNLFTIICDDTFFDEMLWNTLRFILFNVDVESYLDRNDWDEHNHNVLSPRLVYEKLIHHINRRAKKAVKPLIKGRHQILYLEPGFEDEAKEAYNIEMKNRKFNIIMKAINECNKLNEERYIDNIIMRCGIFKNSKKLGFHLMSRRSFKELYKQMENDPQFGTYLEDDHFKVNLRKKQERSSWHSLVQEGKSYLEVQEIFPNVKNSAYRKYKSILKNNKQ